MAVACHFAIERITAFCQNQNGSNWKQWYNSHLIQSTETCAGQSTL
jgi:hypothetical protein